MAKILVAEDDQAVADTLIDVLTLQRHTIEHVVDGQEALSRLKIYDYDAAILDWSLPSLDGPDICSLYRQSGGTIPILILTAKSAVSAKASGLDAGADDYLTKPFDIEELNARVRALLRRSPRLSDKELTANGLRLNLNQKRVFRDAEEIILVPKEYAVLEFLLRHKGQTFSPEELLNRVWSAESDSTVDAVRQCVKRLRNKIDLPGAPSLIATKVGLGYLIEMS